MTRRRTPRRQAAQPTGGAPAPVQGDLFSDIMTNVGTFMDRCFSALDAALAPVTVPIPPCPVPGPLGSSAAPADRARDRAIAQVERGAPTVWMTQARAVVRIMARNQTTFTTDDVWAAMESEGAGPPPEPRALGAVMRWAQQEGLATPTDRTRKSTRVACHARPVRIWASLKPRSR